MAAGGRRGRLLRLFLGWPSQSGPSGPRGAGHDLRRTGEGGRRLRAQSSGFQPALSLSSCFKGDREIPQTPGIRRKAPFETAHKTGMLNINWKRLSRGNFLFNSQPTQTIFPPLFLEVAAFSFCPKGPTYLTVGYGRFPR